MSDVAPTIHQDSHLTADLAAQLGQLTREVIAEEGVGAQLSSKEALELFGLAGFEALGIAVDLDGGTPRSRRDRPGCR
jgi:hypothetical protein